jgi:ubiquinone/menaquinone biosynthesis C-methylase UbiE
MVEQPFEGYLGTRHYGEALVDCIESDAGFFEGMGLNERLSREKLLVDLGCATGNELGAFQRKYPNITTIGIDINTEYLLEAGRNSPNSRLIRASLFHIPLQDDSVPVLFSSRIFQHCNENRAADIILREARRILKPSDGGVYIMFCEAFKEGEEYNHFLSQVEGAGFKVLKEKGEYGIILQK